MAHPSALVFLCMVVALIFGCSAKTKFQSDHYRDGRFRNLDPKVGGKKSIFALLKWRFDGAKETWPDFVGDNLNPSIAEAVSQGQAKITYINHATLLIQIGSFNILTDPVFFDWVGPARWLGPKRRGAPGIPPEKLPTIHLVLLSHNHYDHLDMNSMKEIDRRYRPKIIVPLGVAELLPLKDRGRVVEMDWWQTLAISEEIKIHFVPAQHWSGRGFFDGNKSFWGGFVIAGKKTKIFFAGDTGYSSHFKMIRERFGPMDVSMMPIGAYEPRWFMREQHTNPEEAVLAHKDLGATLSIGIHFGTFQLTNEGIERPVTDLKKSLGRHAVAGSDFLAPKNGQEIHLAFD